MVLRFKAVSAREVKQYFVAQALVERLHSVLRPFLLRRLKSEVEKQMPGKHEHILKCRLSKRQRTLYEDYMASSDTRSTLSSGNYLGIMNVLMSLRKVRILPGPSIFACWSAHKGDSLVIAIHRTIIVCRITKKLRLKPDSTVH